MPTLQADGCLLQGGRHIIPPRAPAPADAWLLPFLWSCILSLAPPDTQRQSHPCRMLLRLRMHHTVTFLKIEINSAAYVHKISAAVGNILMIDPDNMRVRQCNEPFPLQIVWFTQLSCRKPLRVRKLFCFRLQELLHTADQLLHLVQADKFSRLVCMVIAGAEVDRGKIQMRRKNGNVAEASERRLKAEVVDIPLKLPVSALIDTASLLPMRSSSTI